MATVMENGQGGDNTEAAKGTTAASNDSTPAPDPQGNTSAALAFLKGHCAGWQDDWFVQVAAIVPAQSKEDRPLPEAMCVPPSEIDSLESWIEERQGQQNLYFAVNPLRRQIRKKAKKADIAALAYLHTDNDPRKDEPLDAERARLRNVVAAFPVTPTELVDSGNGLQAFWRLEKPILVPVNSSKEELDELGVMNQQLAQHFSADNCHSIEHLMRLPATVNLPDYRKLAKGRVKVPAQLVYQNEATYSLEAFDFLPPVEQQHSAAVADIDITSVDEAALATRLQVVQSDPELVKLRRGEALPWMKDVTRNSFDFALALVLIRLGFSDGEVVVQLLQYPHGKVAERQDAVRYIGNILKKVRAKLGKDASAAVPGIPAAQHLTTDQANAERLRRAIGHGVMFSARQWFVWDGTHWSADEAAARRQTLHLSALIRDEANEWERKETKSEEEAERNREIVKALRKWSAKSEDKTRLDSAFSILRWLVEVPADTLDADPYLLNAMNGTIDLRTGKLRPHNRDDRITKRIPIAYHPDARAPLFEKTLAEITDEEGHQRKPIAEFLQCWFGYCATGLTSEQVFVVHHGGGANGKSLLLGTIERVMGPYAGTAAPGLLVGGTHDRHPTELADLRGKRMVTAAESGEDGTLREEFIKRATGSDRIKARFMRQDFFEYDPTHKLQLLTNHKPQIRGQDHAIWRRVLLVPYAVTFGTSEAVRQGEAHHVRDDALAERLKAEDEGVLVWLVQGAVKWHLTGLRPPDSVLAAVVEYREEQDRTGQFMEERCERHSEATVPLSQLYAAYQRWARECGYSPLGKGKLTEAVEKRPGITGTTGYYMDFGRRRRGLIFTGLKLL